MRGMDVFDKEIVDNVTEGGKIYQCTTKLYHKILSDTRKCIGYGFINRDIVDASTLKIDTYILAFVKNIQKRIVFCSLNLGVSGVIKDDESIKNIKDNKKSIGDIVKVQVTGFEKSGKIVLHYFEQPLNMISQYHPPHVLQGSQFDQTPDFDFKQNTHKYVSQQPYQSQKLSGWNSQAPQCLKTVTNYDMTGGSSHGYQPSMQPFPSHKNNNMSYQPEQQFPGKTSMYNNSNYYPNYTQNSQ